MEPREAQKLEKRLKRQVAEAICRYRLIEPGDVVMACLSGGKDSYGLLDILLRLRRHAPISFDLIAVHLDQKQPGHDPSALVDYLAAWGVPFHIVEENTYQTVKRLVPEGKTGCSVCSRLRRGVLYRIAKELGATKVALGHHKNDVLETFFLNFMLGGRLKAMPPKLLSEDGQRLLIRPLYFCDEKDLAAWSRVRGFPILPCRLCGQTGKSARAEMKAMILAWQKTSPRRVASMFRALQNITPSHLADPRLFDFSSLAPQEDEALDQPEANHLV